MFNAAETDSRRRPIGIGMIGYSFMGQIHSNAYTKLGYTYPEDQFLPKLIAASGRTRDKVSSFAREFGFNGFYTDWKELIADPAVEVVDNCSADPNHFVPAMEALRLGKHIICEKPLALNLMECEALSVASKETESKHMVCFNYRFLPAIRLAKDMIEAGRIGSIYHIRACYYQSPGFNPDQIAENVWYCRPERVGIMQGIGSHVIDLARFLIGEISSVGGITRTFNTQRRSEDGGVVHVSKDELNIATVAFESGAIGTLESSGISAGHRNRNEIEIYGSKGSLKFTLEDPNHLEICIPGELADDSVGFTRVSVTDPIHPNQCRYLPRGHNQGWEYGHVHALRHFLNCAADNLSVEPWGATFYDGYRAQVIMDSMLEASETGRRVETLSKRRETS